VNQMVLKYRAATEALLSLQLEMAHELSPDQFTETIPAVRGALKRLGKLDPMMETIRKEAL
jgi:hypothetical protein